MSEQVLDSIKNLSKNGKIDKAKAKCKKYLGNNKILSYYIKLLIDNGEIEEAKKLCKEHFNVSAILNQYILVLIHEGNFEEARELCEKNIKNENVIPLYINVLDHYDEKEKIEEIWNLYPYNKYVARACAIYYYRIKDYDMVNKICEKHPFSEDLNRLYEKVNYPDGIKVSAKKEETLYTKINNLINEKKFKEAKKLCEENMDDNRINDFYFFILEQERINNNKKL